MTNKSSLPLAGIISLGCSKNMVDTEFLMGGLASAGWGFTPEMEEADLLLVNTCSFLDSSVEEAGEAIDDTLRWKAECQGRVVVVAGCLVSRFGKSLEDQYPHVDLFLMPGQIPKLPLWLSSPSPRPRRFRGGAPSYLPLSSEQRIVTSGFWAWLKVSDGCDNRCHYCLIPQIRGRHRSRSRRSLLGEAGELISAGVREINVIGQDITRWGSDRSGRGGGFPGLLEGLSDLPGLFRLRLLYLHPSRVDRDISRLAAERERIFPYLDIPIQHASDRVLKGMNRPYGRRHLEETIDRLRGDIPSLALRTTVMVGYPGEGDREFRELLDFLQSYPFENLGAFVFSPQQGTPAADMEEMVDLEVAGERYHEVMSLQADISSRLWKARRGETVEALVLQPLDEEDLWLGRTAWQAPEVDGHIRLRGRAAPGDIVRVKVTGSDAYDLEGMITGVVEDSTSSSRDDDPAPSGS